MLELACYIQKLSIGPSARHRNLVAVALLGPDHTPRSYISLQAALRAGTARITETSTAGNVPELRFVNDGTDSVLLLDGEELVGAKQNRVLNLTILAPAKTSITIPVSCVEAGRWHRTTDDFVVADRALFSRARARKLDQVTDSLRQGGTRRSDQGEVWAMIDEKLSEMRAASPSQAMAAAYDTRRDDLEDFVQGFRPAPGQIGALFAIDGSIVGMDCFDSAETFAELLPKLVRSYALDALGVAWPSEQGISRERVQQFLTSLAAADSSQHAAVGLGEDIRLRSSEIAGAVLWFDGRPVHLCGFLTQGDARKSSRSGRMVSAARRRGMH
jgi:hypothetical protein